MNSEISNQQNHFHKHSDWLSQVDDLNDIEAAQINGGMELVEKLITFQLVTIAVVGIVELANHLQTVFSGQDGRGH